MMADSLTADGFDALWSAFILRSAMLSCSLWNLELSPMTKWQLHIHSHMHSPCQFQSVYLFQSFALPFSIVSE